VKSRVSDLCNVVKALPPRVLNKSSVFVDKTPYNNKFTWNVGADET
jgi:hypothetical protein